jgi:hypothetical protein
MPKNFALSKEKIYNKFHVSLIKERATRGNMATNIPNPYLNFQSVLYLVQISFSETC